MFIKDNNRQSGFSLVEVMMALVLASVVLLVGFQLLALGNQLSARTEALLTVNATIFSKIQEYENKQFNQIAVGLAANNYEIEDFSTQVIDESDGAIKTATAKVYSSLEPNSGSLIKLRAKVDFSYGSKTRVLEYATYIQLGGVGR
jgi:prepilin-type N-terminal cleavage/methylation domain-containing protein